MPAVSTGPSGANTRIMPQMRVFRRDPAEIVPHAADHALDLRRRQARAARRADCGGRGGKSPRRGPIRRAAAPPSAEAQSSGSAPITANNTAKAPASARWRQDIAATGGSEAGRASPRGDRCLGAGHRREDAPPPARHASLSRPRRPRSLARNGCGRRTQSLAVVTRRAAARPASCAQPGDLGGAKRVMIGERVGLRSARRRRRAGWRRISPAGRCRRRRRRAQPAKRSPSTGTSAARRIGSRASASPAGGGPSPSSTIASPRASPAAARSRSGPAGITRRLPKPYSASTTISEQILGDRRVLKAVIEDDGFCAGGDRRPHPGGAVARDPARRARRDQ